MLCYFPGGMLADRYPPRKLMTYSLIATALGGFYLATLPPGSSLYWLFAYWGCTSVLLFWAAMIKETRMLAGQQTQGIAFGLLDGGRGLVASLVASVAVIILAMYLNSSAENDINKSQAMQAVIIFYSLMTCLAALLIWSLLPKTHHLDTIKSSSIKVNSITQITTDSKIWLQGGIIICAYCGFKSLDNYGLYATQVLQMNQLESANLTAFASYARPIAALAAGIIADRWHTGKSVLVFFAISAISFIIMSQLQLEAVAINFIIANLSLTFVSVYALRGIYFALIEQTQLKISSTGAAVGLISLVGYTPDIFFSSLTGRILDANPGFIGFQNYFLTLGFISSVGILLVHRLNKQTK